MAMRQIRLSHSTLEVLDTCERLYQIEFLLEGQRAPNEAAHFSRGHSFGKGVQVYLLTGDMDKALFAAWLAYYPQLEDRPKVSLHRTLHALLCAQETLDTLREQYDVVSFQGQPAIELGARIIIDETFYYSMALDLVLQHKETKLYIVVDVKYTGSWLPVEGMFYNSGQLVGYSILLDTIVGEELAAYGVLYFVCQDKNKEPKELQFHILEWDKTPRDRLKWFITLGLDVERIKRMRELNHFPQRVRSCIRFNKLCHHHGTCGLTIGDKERDTETDRYEYQFTFQLDDIIKEHLERGQHA